MSRRRGLTLIELTTTMAIATMAIGGALTLMVTGLKSFNKTRADINVSQPSAQAVRRVIDTLRGAMAVTITNSGKTITYQLPAYTSGADPDTGEKELRYPLRWDNVTRTYTVEGNKLVSYPGGKAIIKNLTATDPMPGSTQYGQAYAPFQSTTIGSRRAITVTFIALENASGKSRYARMKSTVLIQNAK